MRIATRKSPLALAQARLVATRLGEFFGLPVELLPMSTTGDRQAQWSLEKQGGKGLFTTELEEALISGEADLAVHSAKDLPGRTSEKLIIAGYLPRADPRDVLVLRSGVAHPGSEASPRPAPSSPCQKNGALTLATGSPRRRGQLALLFPEASFCEIRGNVETRLEKVASGFAVPGGAPASATAPPSAPAAPATPSAADALHTAPPPAAAAATASAGGRIPVDATVLAAAGLARLGIRTWPGLEFRPLDFGEMVPAVGQGAIAVQTRIDEAARYAPILDPATARAVRVERAFQAALDSGCQTAFAAHAAGDSLYLFHEKTGRRRFPLAEADYHAPADTAKRLLSSLGLL
ncbi:hypothetical protein AXK11_04655 [Cephaloticoccus primus]|uniref:hydroxymethylbilane synthase n=1 Tax=Cephaloticoccus primus TaxID=1548207 RepID=A0A139SNT2_9BACT|nr:hypothetical protein AXK11_04655 [Cephaloticoccus primus]